MSLNAGSHLGPYVIQSPIGLAGWVRCYPHICTLYDVGEQQGTAFLVMEYLEGETLADKQVQRQQCDHRGQPRHGRNLERRGRRHARPDGPFRDDAPDSVARRSIRCDSGRRVRKEKRRRECGDDLVTLTESSAGNTTSA
jgi:hypothetical protein